MRRPKNLAAGRAAPSDAKLLARGPETRREVARVFYPGLPSHPDHETARRVLDGFGGMVGIELIADFDQALHAAGGGAGDHQREAAD